MNSKHLKKMSVDYVRAVALLLIPAILFYALFIAYPVFKNVYNSFFTLAIKDQQEVISYVGLENFFAVLRDATFIKAAGNTLRWAFTSPFFEIPIALLLAMVLRSGFKGSKILRTIWFMPVMLPQVVVGIIWTWIYNYQWGFLNTVLRSMGMDSLAKSWLGTPETALPSLIIVTTWIWVGFNMVILLASISSIPNDILEASTIDGAKKSHQLIYIVIPMIRPVLVNLLILCFIGKMKVFDLIQATTQGGPLWATETVATYTVERAFYWATFDRGYPSAMSTIWFIVIMVISLTFTGLLQRKESLEY